MFVYVSLPLGEPLNAHQRRYVDRVVGEVAVSRRAPSPVETSGILFLFLVLKYDNS